VLDIALRIEKNGETIYRRAIQKVSSQKLRDALKWMADEEVDHIEWFSCLKEKIQETSGGIMADELSSDMLKRLMGDQSFTLKEVDFSQIDSVDELVRIFIEFEKDSIIFYEMLAGFIKNQETFNQLQKIIAEERQHIEKLENISIFEIEKS
jgi:rubrerythrin